MNRFVDIDVSFKQLPPVYGFQNAEIMPIEKALEPIVSLINELPYYIDIAKRNCHFPSEHGLTHDESAAVYIYTIEWGETSLHRVLNKALQSENRQQLKIWFPYLKLFDTALDKLPTVKRTLWRGVLLDIRKSFTVNQNITLWSINSCSLSSDVIKSFIGDNKNSTLFLIEAVNGKNVSGYTGNENENEVILRLGTQLHVKDNLDYSDLHVVHLVEIDKETTPSAMNEMQMAAKPSNTNTSISSSMAKIGANRQWNQNGITVGGGHEDGNRLNQLDGPWGIYIDDDDQTIYIADTNNHRIVKWEYDATKGQIVAGGNGKGNRADQLNDPRDVIVDKINNSFIISDTGNRRVVQWPLRNGTSGQTIIFDVCCHGLTMDNLGYLYVPDLTRHEVRRWRIGDTSGTLVAGGNGEGNGLNQLNAPVYVFVDEEYSVYVSDQNNDRVMKWMKGAKEGIVVAGGQSKGNGLTQLSGPRGVIVDHLGTIYVADYQNHRVMRWFKGAKQGDIVVGGNGRGKQLNQLYYPQDLSFDGEDSLYVVDLGNDRIQRFNID